mmetsp:Transcript_27187/g.65057  ORF Transcript_27187/g.65057 Transcript_27187/m.65057 type:complete len:659 (-) Transcript_27187:1283-3259(-)|eukprot:CAMPEP_0113472874 /NCGR_PEP_ID=MMETSP0014_2-20120614/17746_1 /TAXON_ID=2857 /ORGANISM="Nitzschia sp." /LENGTH=658 /DNA_ID=CAMNT_0000365609 /DNA_START=20 /DNA_END=1996 /DNA_ORIENTATION=- /assembly_acc=CAM_ASM_000159
MTNRRAIKGVVAGLLTTAAAFAASLPSAVDGFAPFPASHHALTPSPSSPTSLSSPLLSPSSSSILRATTKVSQTPEQKSRRKELLKRDGSFFQLDRSSGRVEFGASAKLVTTLVDEREDNDGDNNNNEDLSEMIKQWLSDGRGLAMSIWDPELLSDLGDDVYRLQTMALKFVTMQLSPTVDVQMWTQKGQNVKTGESLPVFNLQSVRYDPNVQLFPGMGSVTAESLGIVIEVVGELIPTKDGKGVTGKISFATSGVLPPPLLILPDQVLKKASDTINDVVVQFAIQSFQSGAINQFKQFRRAQQSRPVTTDVGEYKTTSLFLSPTSLFLPSSSGSSTGINGSVETATTATNGATTWYDATVVSTEHACPSGKSLQWIVQVDETQHDSTDAFEYNDPGKFVQLKCNNDDGSLANCDDTNNKLFLAMCGPPSYYEPNKLEFLVKTTSNIPWLQDIKPGSKVQITQCQGQGLASSIATVLEDALANKSTEDDTTDSDDDNEDGLSSGDTDIEHLLLVAAGSGIAPLMACLREGGGWLFNSVPYVSMYYGEWTQDDLCFQEYLFPTLTGSNGSDDGNGNDIDTSVDTSKQMKIYTIPCLSKQKRDFTKGIWSGHVQNVMWSRGIVNPEKTLAVICGMEEMETDVRQLLKRAGVDENRILTNR